MNTVVIDMLSTILHVDLDAFFASVEVADKPWLKGKPVIVGANPHEGRGIVNTASYEARRFGIHSGMSIREAYRKCSHGIFLAPHYERYTAIAHEIRAILYRYTPQVYVTSIDEAYLDLTKSLHLFGTARMIGEWIRYEIKRRFHITTSVGIASTMEVAKVAASQAKPDGLLEVAAGDEAGFLAPLPIRELPGVGTKMERELLAMEIHTIGDLAKTSLSVLLKRFGAWGYALWQHAHGVGRTTLPEEVPPQQIGKEVTFSKDTSDLRFLRNTLMRLTDEVCYEMRLQGEKARKVTLKLRYADFTTFTRQTTLAAPTNATQLIAQAALQLFFVNLPPGRLVRLIGMGVGDFVKRAIVQPSLFDLPKTENQLWLFIDRLRKRRGLTVIKMGWFHAGIRESTQI
ncbi:MAG: DNA polymerase IV [Parcubacteria group bacterium]|nr:DNA polymerase IV [Parcubacteria group bacterium]